MIIELKEITIKEVVNGYLNNAEEGVVGYGGKLNIRPIYQREFIYRDKQRDAVIETIKKEFPLNVMYWVKNGNDTYELLDGQQRTISFCEYVAGKFSINNFGFYNLTDVEQEKILNYKLMIYICEGNNKEKLDWFETVNIAGVKLTDQELLNAVYTGEWLTDAKRYFSKTGCAAYGMGSNYLKGIAIRQDYLETVINWISDGNIKKYMSDNQQKPNANELWLYFQSVISWIKVVFPNYRKEMKGVSFGTLYNEFKNKEFNSTKLEEEIVKLMRDEDVTKKTGIYEYVLTRDEKFLSIRAFTTNQKREVYERQNGVCPHCKEKNNKWKIEEMEADHKKLWSEGGKTITENCQMLCKDCHRDKSIKQ